MVEETDKEEVQPKANAGDVIVDMPDLSGGGCADSDHEHRDSSDDDDDDGDRDHVDDGEARNISTLMPGMAIEVLDDDSADDM